MAPLLVETEEVARLLSAPVVAVEELIRDGHLGTRTINGKKLVRFEDVLAFVHRDDPQQVNFPR